MHCFKSSVKQNLKKILHVFYYLLNFRFQNINMNTTKSCGSKACTVLLKTLLLTFNAVFLVFKNFIS